MLLLTKLSVSGSSQKNGFPSFSCFLTKFSMSTSKLAEVVPSDPCVDCSHFSNNSANKGKSGCLGTRAGERTGNLWKLFISMMKITDFLKCLHYNIQEIISIMNTLDTRKKHYCIPSFCLFVHACL